MIKIESTWKREIKEQTLQLTFLLDCGRTVRSSHRRCSIKKYVLKDFAISTWKGTKYVNGVITAYYTRSLNLHLIYHYPEAYSEIIKHQRWRVLLFTKRFVFAKHSSLDVWQDSECVPAISYLPFWQIAKKLQFFGVAVPFGRLLIKREAFSTYGFLMIQGE